jgi:uncharacterized protein with beta-barrel porin domain
VAVQPPIGTLPPDRVAASEARLRVARPDEYCIDPRAPRTTAEGEEINLPVCPPERLAQAGAQGVAPASQVPLTEGRDLGAPTLWNVWAEGSVLGISDERFGLDMETTVGTGTFGIDRRLSDDVVLGVSFSVQNSSTEGFGDFLQVDANGFTVGPYVAVRLSPHWAMDASLTYGHYDNDIELAILGGDYTSRTYGGTVNLHGQYSVGEYLVRPKASVSYTHIDNDGYDLEGSIFGFPIDLVSRRQLQLRRFRSHD